MGTLFKNGASDLPEASADSLEEKNERNIPFFYLYLLKIFIDETSQGSFISIGVLKLGEKILNITNGEIFTILFNQKTLNINLAVLNKTLNDVHVAKLHILVYCLSR